MLVRVPSIHAPDPARPSWESVARCQMPARKSTTKHDVALAEVQRKASREAILARGMVFAVVVAAATLPINALQGIIEPLAGQTTVVNVNVVLGATVAISVVVNLFQFMKGSSQRRSLKRLRDRVTELEGRE